MYNCKYSSVMTDMPMHNCSFRDTYFCTCTTLIIRGGIRQKFWQMGPLHIIMWQLIMDIRSGWQSQRHFTSVTIYRKDILSHHHFIIATY